MLDQTATCRAGMFVLTDTHEAVPLAGVTIDAEIRSFYGRVVVAQRYVNTEKRPIEAVYVFPLEAGAAICAFEATIDGTLVVGEVHERDKAFDMYDDAMQAGHGAFLLDEERPDVFQASIGNLPPGKEVTVRLTYVTELSVDERRLRFVIPTTLSPRYAPIEDHTGVGCPDAQRLNPPVALSVPYGLSLSVRVAIPGGITCIESPSHPIAVKMAEREATVSLGQQDAALDRDFVLAIEAQALETPHAVVERDDTGTEAVAVAFAPAFETTSAASELIFLVDRSGSMQGTSIEEVRNALQLCLRSMTPGCRFNIVGFGSSYESLFAETRAYEQSSLDSATAHVAMMQANLGGTEILPALGSVLAAKPPSSMPRQVVIMTDGQVTNTDAVIALAAEHADTARIFTFGIGAGASHHLVRGLARAGGGTAEFIFPGERIEPKVLRQLSRLLSPALTNVRVEWSGGGVTQAPARVPPVFAGERLLVYGFVNGRRPSAVRLTADSPSGRLAFDVTVPDATAVAGRTVCTLAARARIRELEEGSEWLASRGSRQTDRKESGARREIIALGLRYGLMSRETSFVAIERRETPVEGDVQLRKVPIALTSGWGGAHGVSSNPAPLMARLSAGGRFGVRMRDAGGTILDSISLRGMDALGQRGAPDETIALSAPLLSSLPPRHPRPESHRRMHALIVMQAADGSWDLTPEFASILGCDLDQLRVVVDRALGPRKILRRVWATALAVACLERFAPDARQEWDMLARKARAFIDAAAIPSSDDPTWIGTARKFLRDLNGVSS
jgi:Ca-activated chloride channel homolog